MFYIHSQAASRVAQQSRDQQQNQSNCTYRPSLDMEYYSTQPEYLSTPTMPHMFRPRANSGVAQPDELGHDNLPPTQK